jgi:mannose-6-phosphate isomerase-like protein (cupin superfamily)
MDAFELADLVGRRTASGRPYLEFVRVPDLSLGLYVLPRGGTDGQQPHTEDEAYYVVAGRARVTVGEEVRDVGPGSIVFVAATVPHRFHDIEEELVILVVFGPAEGSRGEASGPDGGA